MELWKFLDDARERKDAQAPKGTSKYRVALLADIKPQNIYKIFDGRTNPSKKNLRKICGILDLKYTGFKIETKDGEIWEDLVLSINKKGS